jgi:hypothetical protein
MTFHFVAPASGDIGSGKIRLSYAGQVWPIWLGVTGGKLWAFNIPPRSSLPPSLQAFYDSLAIDQNTVYTPQDGKNWFTALPPWLDISRYDPDVVGLPTLTAVSSTAGQAAMGYSVTIGSISGHVFQPNGVTPLAGALLRAALVNGAPGPTAYSSADGSYTFSALPGGNYQISTQITGYLKEYYTGDYYGNKAAPVKVGAPDDISGIDFIMKASLPGDANVSAIIDMGDIVKVERVILGIDPGNTNADANLDGKIDMADVTKIERIILGLP